MCEKMKSLILVFILCGITAREVPLKNAEEPTEIKENKRRFKREEGGADGDWLVERIKVEWPKGSNSENEEEAEQESTSSTKKSEKLQNQLQLGFNNGDLPELQNEPVYVLDQEDQQKDDKPTRGSKDRPIQPPYGVSEDGKEDLGPKKQSNQPTHSGSEETKEDQAPNEQPSPTSHIGSEEYKENQVSKERPSQKDQFKPKQLKLEIPKGLSQSSNIGRNKEVSDAGIDDLIIISSEEHSGDGLEWSHINVDDSSKIPKIEEGSQTGGNSEDLRGKYEQATKDDNDGINLEELISNEKGGRIGSNDEMLSGNEKDEDVEDVLISLEELISKDLDKTDEDGLDFDFLGTDIGGKDPGHINAVTKDEEGSWEHDARDISWTFGIPKDSIKASDIVLAREGPGSIVRAAEGLDDSIADWKKVSWSKENDKRKRKK